MPYPGNDGHGFPYTEGAHTKEEWEKLLPDHIILNSNKESSLVDSLFDLEDQPKEKPDYAGFFTEMYAIKKAKRDAEKLKIKRNLGKFGYFKYRIRCIKVFIETAGFINWENEDKSFIKEKNL